MIKKNYLQTHGTAMGTKMVVAFANLIFMGKVETKVLSQGAFKPLVWKRHIEDIFSPWDTNRSREVLTQFIDQANNDHPTIKFTAEILKQKLLVRTPAFTKVKDSYMNQCLTYAPTTSPLNMSASVHTSLLVSPMHKELRKVSSKERT